MPFLPLLLACGLPGSVVTSVHHAEVIALKVGEPFGTLILALSVTTIEVALVISMILQGGPEAMALPRDTLFAAVMIILNGIIGMSLLMGGRKNLQQKFNLEGTTDALCTLSLFVVISLVLPNFTSGAGIYTPFQLGSDLRRLSCLHRFQTVLHRDYFIVEGSVPEASGDSPDMRTTIFSLGMLVV